MSIFQRAKTRFREDGARGIVAGGVGLASSVVQRRVEALERWYWIRRGYRTLSVGDVSTEFIVDSAAAHHELSYLAANERAVLEDFLHEIGPDDTVYDIGANLGVYAILAAEVGATSVAIEPFPPTVERLRENVRHNGVDVTILDVAIGDDDETVQLQGDDTMKVGSVGIAPASETGTVTVSQRRLDSVAGEQAPTPDVVKIDVEGAEGLVLAGGLETIPRCRTLYVEIHRENVHGASAETYGHSARGILETLREYGFECSTIVDRANQEIIKATAPSRDDRGRPRQSDQLEDDHASTATRQEGG